MNSTTFHINDTTASIHGMMSFCPYSDLSKRKKVDFLCIFKTKWTVSHWSGLSKHECIRASRNHSMGVVMYVKYTFLFILSGWLKRGVIRPRPLSLMQVQKLPSGCELAPHLHLLHYPPSPPPTPAGQSFPLLSNTHKWRRRELSISIWITQINSIFWWQTEGPAGQPPLIRHPHLLHL